MLKTTLEKLKAIRHKLHVEVSAERAKTSAEFAVKEMQKDAVIEGFRKGRAPFDIARKYFGAPAEKEIAKQIVRDTYSDAVTQESAAPISDPSVQYESYAEGTPFIYRAEFDVMPEITVPEYEGIKIEKEKVEVTDGEIESEIRRLRHAMTQLEPADDAELGPGIMAIVDFKGTVDGKPFKGSEAQNFVVDFGNLLPAFEEKIKGMKKKDERDIAVIYPPDYFNKEIAGKEGAYHVVLKDLRKKIVPDLNEDFVKSLGNFKNMDEVKADIKKRVAKAKDDFQQRRLGFQAIRQLTEKNAFDVPDVMVQNELSAMLEDLARQMNAQGKTMDESTFDTKAFIDQNMEEAKKRVRGYLIAFAIAKQVQLAVTDEEVNARMTVIAKQSKQPADKVKAHFEKENLKDQLKSQLLYEKTLDFIVERAKVKEVKPKKEKKG